MLENSFSKVYTKFKMDLYSKVFKEFKDKDVEPLSAMEVISMEIIVALGSPTINEFATAAKLSPPNAAYKVNKLIQKGYINKIQSTEDKREYHIEATEAYKKNYGVIYDYIAVVLSRVQETFSPDDVKKLDEILETTADELMPEVEIGEEKKLK
ncbi:MarR family transcriptional regulator [Aminicella lysinilytica]|jgi:DNA-binding MarR family transcriptional regulator|uniref:MarR family transcriptional regulator n=1 Tax=Aminicella lysinilytica TaxID=433323 RepID=UPI0026F0505B|nr:MarR family transcriptional regulator [Aminicella lysinilytica]